MCRLIDLLTPLMAWIFMSNSHRRSIKLRGCASVRALFVVKVSHARSEGKRSSSGLLLFASSLSAGLGFALDRNPFPGQAPDRQTAQSDTGALDGTCKETFPLFSLPRRRKFWNIRAEGPEYFHNNKLLYEWFMPPETLLRFLPPTFLFMEKKSRWARV